MDLCQKKSKCRNPDCHDFIYKLSARLAQTKMVEGHRKTLYYHIPCWMAMPCYPKGKSLSSYVGFHSLDASIQEQILSSFVGSPKDIRSIPVTPPPLTKCRPPPKQCLATKTSDGTRCQIKTNSSIPAVREAARPMLEEGVWYCEHHKHVEIDMELVEKAEQERNDIMSRDQQHLEVATKQSPQKRKRSR